MIFNVYDNHGKMPYILVFGYSKAQMQKQKYFHFRGEIFCFFAASQLIIRFGNFRRELISIFAGRHLPRNFFVDTYFPLVIFAGSIFSFSRGDTLRGDFLYFRGESIFVKFVGTRFLFSRGDTLHEEFSRVRACVE